MRTFKFRSKRKKAPHPAPYPTTPPFTVSGGHRRRIAIPDKIHRYYIPLSVIKRTGEFIQRFGHEERECYVWWGGYFTADGNGQVVTALCPNVTTEYGHISLDTRQLTTLHAKLRELDQVLLIELHSHPPGAGGQNAVDAAHPAVAYCGFVSIVVPDFGFPHFYDPRKAYVYEYIQENRWRELTGAEIESRFVIEPAALEFEI